MDFSYSISFTSSVSLGQSMQARFFLHLFCFLIFYHVFSSHFSNADDNGRRRLLYFCACFHFHSALNILKTRRPELEKYINGSPSSGVSSTHKFNKKNFFTFNLVIDIHRKKILFFAFFHLSLPSMFLATPEHLSRKKTYNFRLVVVIQKCQRTAKSSQKIS